MYPIPSPEAGLGLREEAASVRVKRLRRVFGQPEDAPLSMRPQPWEIRREAREVVGRARENQADGFAFVPNIDSTAGQID